MTNFVELIGPIVIITSKIMIFIDVFVGTLLNLVSVLWIFGAMDRVCVYSFKQLRVFMFNLAVVCHIVILFERHLYFTLHFHMLLHELLARVGDGVCAV
jgi:hypothetical protein